MRAPKPALPWFLAAFTSAGALVGCATAKPTPSSATPGAAAAPTGPVIPFAFAPPLGHPWGLRVARHRTLPPPPGTDGQALHFDSEEDSRIAVTRQGNGDFVLTETLAQHSETKNGDPNPDAVMVALTGVPVRTKVSPDGLFRGSVDAAQTVQQIARNWPGGNAAFANLPPEVFTRELERDWRLGAEVYFTRPIHVGEPVYSLLSVSLPELPGKYVAVAERFAAPVPHGDGTRQVTSTQEIFGKRDARWPAAQAALRPLMQSLGVSDGDVLERFSGQGGETVGVRSLQVYSASYQGEGVFPLVTERGAFPLKFRVEEVAGAIDPPAIPLDPKTTAGGRARTASHLARR